MTELIEVGGLPPSPIEPRNDWVVLQVIPEGMTSGGLHKPETAYEELPKMRVLAVGPGPRIETESRRAEIDLHRGDVVHIFGHVVAIDQPQKIVMAQEGVIICVVERGPGGN